MEDIQDFHPPVMTFLAWCAVVAFWIVDDDEEDTQDTGSVVVLSLLCRLSGEFANGLQSQFQMSQSLRRRSVTVSEPTNVSSVTVWVQMPHLRSNLIASSA